MLAGVKTCLAGWPLSPIYCIVILSNGKLPNHPGGVMGVAEGESRRRPSTCHPARRREQWSRGGCGRAGQSGWAGEILPNLQLLCDTFISISYNIAEWTLEQTYLKEYSCKQLKPTGM